MAQLSYNETTLSFNHKENTQLETITYPRGTKSYRRILDTYEVVLNGIVLPVYTLEVTTEGSLSAEYKLYARFKDGETQLVHGFYDKPNFPFKAMVEIYSSIVSTTK
jgi:hypothetical protein